MRTFKIFFRLKLENLIIKFQFKNSNHLKEEEIRNGKTKISILNLIRILKNSHF